MGRTHRSLAVVAAALGICSCRGTELQESTRNLPDGITWVLSDQPSLFTLENLAKGEVLERDRGGRVTRRQTVEENSLNVTECDRVPHLTRSALFDHLVGANNQLGDHKLPTPTELKALNEAGYGAALTAPASMLTLVSGRTDFQISATGAVANKVTGALAAGTTLSDVTLMMLDAEFVYQLKPEVADCVTAAYRVSKKLADALKEAQEHAAASGGTAEAVVYTGAVVGAMVGLSLRSATLTSDANFDTGPVNVKLKTNLSTQNMSISYAGYGRLSPTFSLADVLRKLEEGHDPAVAASALASAVEKYAVVGLKVARVKPEAVSQAAAGQPR